MKKTFLLLSLPLYNLAFSQVGIGVSYPTAMLDILSKDNTDTTKALRINNSSNTEMVTVLNDGKVGIGNPSPLVRLDARVSNTDSAIGIGQTSQKPDDAGEGAIRYSTFSGGVLQYSNGISWNTLESNVQKSLVSGYFSGNINNGDFNTLTCTKEVDTNGDFSDNTFTVPRNGNYTFTFAVSSDSSGNNNGNGTWEGQVRPIAGSDNVFVSRYISSATYTGVIATAGSTTMYLTAGTEMVFKLWNNTGSFKTIDVPSYNRFSIIEN